MRKKILLVLLVAVVLGLVAFFFVVPGLVEGGVNGVLRRPPYEASERARSLHGRLLVADLHADSLIWDRDLLERGERGHVDVPRLAEGGVALQFFTVVTKVPFGSNYESNEGDTDKVTPLVIAERWPFKAWWSLKERALYQSRKLHNAAGRSGGKLVIVKTAGDLARYLEQRAAQQVAGASAQQRGEALPVAAILGVEGAHALDGEVGNVDALFEAGFRMMAPTHFFDNEWGGSAHGARKGGLTGRGREMVRRMESRGMIVDLAHASAETFRDVIGMATRPVFVSHTGVRGTCDNVRNLSDEQLKGVAATGGVVGIGFWDAATCGTDARAVARSIRHAAGVVGARHVALGSDFDGAVVEPFDTTGLVEITDALIAEGFGDEEVALIMGGNVLRVLSETLPR
jgi:microsomal dipeptidase-like Zn-dependent dipeptidase